jgi:hypothetical protein
VAQWQGAMHQTILVVDVEEYGDWRRSNENQVAVRDGMYQALRLTFDDVGIPWDDCYQEDRGDGLFVLAPSGIQKGLFSVSLPLKLADRLHAHNKAHEPEEGIRLRMALHAGEISSDDHGVVGTALNQAFRLIEADQLKIALKGSPGVLAVIASSWFYGEVIKQSHECRPDTYRPILVNKKETATVGWVALPDHHGPLNRNGPAETWRVRILDHDGHVHGAGVLMHGRYVITAAKVIERSLNLPGNDCCPGGQVLFDVPQRPQINVRRAETIWRSAEAAGGLAGLSVVGPAIGGIDEPPLRRVGLSDPKIVRAHRFAAAENGPAAVQAWGRLPAYSTDSGQPVMLSPVADFGPHINHEYSGADVVDVETGAVLGITLAAPQPSERTTTAMVCIDSIAAQWPLLGRIVSAAERLPGGGAPAPKASGLTRRSRSADSERPLRLERADFMRLIDLFLQVPELATTQSRHTMVSELPLEVALTAPRSSVDRADVAGLLWTCGQTRTKLAKLRSQVQKNARAGNARQELLKDLDRLLLS